MCSCSHSNNTSNPTQPEGLKKGTVVLEAQGRTLRVEVEVALTTQQRNRGLMYRRKLNPYQGMLFVFDEEDLQSFWMKNTYIPLDMIFIDQKLKVVGVVENAEPMTTTSRTVNVPSKYVLEVRGGFARTHRVGVGTRVKLEY